jgi:hypothetical protein
VALHLYSGGHGQKLASGEKAEEGEMRESMMPDMLAKTHNALSKILADLHHTREELGDNGKMKEAMMDALEKSSSYSKSVPQYHADAEYFQDFIKKFRAQTEEDHKKLTEPRGELDRQFNQVVNDHPMPLVDSTFRVEHTRVQSPWHGPQTMSDLQEKIRQLEEELREAKGASSQDLEEGHVREHELEDRHLEEGQARTQELEGHQQELENETHGLEQAHSTDRREEFPDEHMFHDGAFNLSEVERDED